MTEPTPSGPTRGPETDRHPPTPPTTHPRVLAVGDEIGPYVIRGTIGQGGMGIVYRGTDTRLGRDVALKMLPEELTDDPEQRAGLEREARLLATVNHPNIATVHSLEQTEGRTFLTMELVDGASLSERLRPGPLEVGDAIGICRQIAAALEAAHGQGIVHRDLKPPNIVINSSDRVKVLDFGLAQVFLTLEEPSGERRPVGTPGYMSPEQLRGEVVDHRADVWAFGCILYECLVGQPVFPGRLPSDRIMATLHRDPDWDALPADTPPRVRTLLEHCLTRDLSARLTEMTGARNDLEEEMALERIRGRRAGRPGRSGDEVPSGLPTPLSCFIGRKREIGEVGDLLEGHRFLTLTGVGGGGKTRLAVEVGNVVSSRFPDGVQFVDLAPLASPLLVEQAVASNLGLKEASGQGLTELLLRHLGPRRLLLILDNCEHMLDGCATLVTDLLGACPALKILATSREPLRVAGERVFHVPPLATLDDGHVVSLDEAAGIEAIELFVERVRGVNPHFGLSDENVGLVATICRRLDGIPLAIELAAARANVLTMADIAERLDDRFELLRSRSTTVASRHQTLRALVDWSYEQLSEAEQRVLRALSVSPIGLKLPETEVVCAGAEIEPWDVLEALSQLVDKSLLEMEIGSRTGRARYRLLETIRTYAQDRLREEDEEAEVQHRFGRCFLAMARGAEPHLDHPEGAKWVAELEEEDDNLRVALDNLATDPDDMEPALRLGNVLGAVWLRRGYWSAGATILEELLARPGVERHPEVRVHVVNWAANIARWRGEYGRATSLFWERHRIALEIGDELETAGALTGLGTVAQLQGHVEQARSLYEDGLSIRRRMKDEWGIAASLNNLGVLAELQKDYAAARAYFEEGLTRFQKLDDLRMAMWCLSGLGVVAEREGDWERARSCQEEVLTMCRDLEDPVAVAGATLQLGSIAFRRGDLERARELFEQSLQMKEELGDVEGATTVLDRLGELSRHLGDFGAARRYLIDSLNRKRQRGDPRRIGASLRRLGIVEASRDRLERAAGLLAAANRWRGVGGRGRADADPIDVEAILTRARATLGDAAFEMATHRGQTMTLDQAIEFALGDDDGP